MQVELVVWIIQSVCRFSTKTSLLIRLDGTLQNKERSKSWDGSMTKWDTHWKITGKNKNCTRLEQTLCNGSRFCPSRRMSNVQLQWSCRKKKNIYAVLEGISQSTQDEEELTFHPNGQCRWTQNVLFHPILIQHTIYRRCLMANVELSRENDTTS